MNHHQESKEDLREKPKLAREKENNESDEVEIIQKVKAVPLEDLESPPEDEPRPKPDGETRQEMLEDDPARAVAIGMDMDPEGRVNLASLLRENADVFKFSADKMAVMVHRPNGNSAVRPVK